MAVNTVERGSAFSSNFSVYLKDGKGNLISPFHDVSLYGDREKGILNMIVEIPRWTNAKMEINKEKSLNPIKQDIKKGNVRFVKNVFPYHGYIWNYGALPQTWEDPSHVDSRTGAKGDDDPLDVVEIGHKIHSLGSVVQVKPLGLMALIDEGETDWKIICIDVTDPLADKMNDISDVDKYMPGFLKATYDWFRLYKIPDGKPENVFAFGGEAKDRAFALSVIEETHTYWKSLMESSAESAIARHNTSGQLENYGLSAEEAVKLVEQEPASSPPNEIPQEVNTWYYV